MCTEPISTYRIPFHVKQQVHVFQCNVRNEEEIQALVQFSLEKMGRINGLVNNAGGNCDAHVIGWMTGLHPISVPKPTNQPTNHTPQASL